MALGLTQPLTEMITRNISWWLKAWDWQPFHLHMPIVLKSGSLNLLELSGRLQACNGIALPCTGISSLLISVLVRCKGWPSSLDRSNPEEEAGWESEPVWNLHKRDKPGIEPLFFDRPCRSLVATAKCFPIRKRKTNRVIGSLHVGYNAGNGWIRGAASAAVRPCRIGPRLLVRRNVTCDNHDSNKSSSYCIHSSEI
jgi:hypothetical protein